MTSMKKVTVKWGAKQYDLDVDEMSTCQDFMTTLSDMTGVEVTKMKVMMKPSGVLKPTPDTLKSKGLQDKAKVMMIGHLSNKTVTAPSGTTTRFVEDLTKEEKMKLFDEHEKTSLPIGIQNLGVTCYANSTWQVLRSIQPVKDALIEFRKGSTPATMNSPIDHSMVANDMAQLMVDLEGGEEAPRPMKLLACLRSMFPELKRKAGDNMGFMQQDVDEFWHYMTEVFEKSNVGGDKNVLKNEFAFDMKTTTRFDQEFEGQTEVDASVLEVKEAYETMFKMSAFVGSATQPITLAHQGMKLALSTDITKHVPELNNKEYHFKQESCLATLPNYLNLHFVRFEWKRNTDGGTRAKVTRRIGFSTTMDLYDFCDESLKRALRPARNAGALDVDEVKAPAVDKGDDVDMEEELVTKPDGTYSLIAVITHEGRNADSGHYVCWRKKYVDTVPADKKEKNNWIKFDDDKVSEHQWDTIDLAGGRGDYHMAYLTFWKQNKITVKKSVYDEMEKEVNERIQKMVEAETNKNSGAIVEEVTEETL